jgi:fructose-1,6-bisphosphatase II / sedoheptulose-1,7-bisphosphatase
MTIDKKYINLFHNVSVKAAFASYHQVGKKIKLLQIKLQWMQ